jgi:hypothetical protein
MKLFILILGLFSITACAGIDLQMIENSLKGEGLKGEIHGSSLDGKLYVITFRNPDNFFENFQFPLVTEDPAILNTLQSAKRHQFYKVKGEFFNNKSPIKHINIKSLELVKDYSSGLDQMPYEYKGILTDLNGQKEFTGRVHAVAEDGKFLVMEYKDRIIPVLVREQASIDQAKLLYRGDKVKIHFAIRAEPEAPTHLNLELKAKMANNQSPIEVIESLVAHHGEPVTKTGTLVKFPKSPQINFNIYALLVEDETGAKIQFTITNLEDIDLFLKVREKIEKVWDDNSFGIINDRNKMINPRIKITAKGTYNMIDRGQANPQIIIKNIDDVTFEITK